MEIRARAREGATKAEVAAAAGDRGVGGDDDDTQEEGGAGTRGTTSGQWRDKADGGGRGRREAKGGWRQMMAAEVRMRGITPEAATTWLAQYRGCVGTELYEFAAEAALTFAEPIAIA